MSNRTVLHIIYVHGFHGDHTTFQAFPTHLHQTLLPQLPTSIELRSILYPTYKSKRPIAVATQNFLSWVDALPAGPVILCGHSMGGLLIAEAATSPDHPAAKRVVALLAFDVPFLGMHPHVVISGIASLLPTKLGERAGNHNTAQEDRGLKSEQELTDRRHVVVVDVPADDETATPSPAGSKTSLTLSSHDSLTVPSIGPPPLPPRPCSQTRSPRDYSRSSSSHPPAPSHSPIISRTLDFIQAHSNNQFVHFLHKHHDDPLGAAKTWVIESFEFGICMFDPKGLVDRYAVLQKWRNPWVVFWTESTSGEMQNSRGVKTGNFPEDEVAAVLQDGGEEQLEATAALSRLYAPTESANLSPSPSPSRSRSHLSSPDHAVRSKSEEKAPEEQREKAPDGLEQVEKALRKIQAKEFKALDKQKDDHGHTAHHFVVRPFKGPSSPMHSWEKVKIQGAKDEVEAHCGLFMPTVNLGYDAFVIRVSRVVEGWLDGRM